MKTLFRNGLIYDGTGAEPFKGDVLIEVKNLYKSFGENVVLDYISMEIKKGEVISVIGPSGCGKSTFIRSLNLLEEPTGGSIIFDGVDITKKKVPDAKGRMHRLDIDRHLRAALKAW